MIKQFLNIDQLSEYLSLSKSNIYKKVANKEIPYHKVGARTLFDIEEINIWVRTDGSLTEMKSISIQQLKPHL